ncbi:hypothetical protein U6B65_08800 [Oscillospiraceae bacterium MB08-C2-2]|nr:hypothetical protein U6B65_08800 [Oscillospiraceae bacterium MB08-C2-2]
MLIALVLSVCWLEAFASPLSSYVDIMQSPMDSSFYQRHNLKRVSSGQIPNHYEDRTALIAIGSTKPTGYSLYRIDYARTVTVGVYSRQGLFAIPGSQGGFEPAHFSGQAGILPALYSYSTRKAYIQKEGQLYQLDASGSRYEKTAEKVADLVYYGVNIFTSTDGKGFSRLLQNSVYGSYEAPWYEEITAVLPANTRWIKVELNDTEDFPETQRNMLASVTFSGDNMVLGGEEDLPSGSSSAPSSSAVSSESSKISSSSKSSSSKASSSSQGASSSSGFYADQGQQGEKFSGIVQYSAAQPKEKETKPPSSSPPSQKENAGKFTGVAEESNGGGQAKSSSQEDESTGRQPDVQYRALPTENRDHRGTLAVVYTVLILALGAFVVFRK